MPDEHRQSDTIDAFALPVNAGGSLTICGVHFVEWEHIRQARQPEIIYEQQLQSGERVAGSCNRTSDREILQYLLYVTAQQALQIQQLRRQLQPSEPQPKDT